MILYTLSLESHILTDNLERQETVLFDIKGTALISDIQHNIRREVVTHH